MFRTFQLAHNCRVCREVDSLVLKHIVEGKCTVPWAIMYEIRQIKCLLADIDYKLVHAFREDNKAADRLANWGVKESLFVLMEERKFPKKLKGINVRLDRSGLPNLRIRKIHNFCCFLLFLIIFLGSWEKKTKKQKLFN